MPIQKLLFSFQGRLWRSRFWPAYMIVSIIFAMDYVFLDKFTDSSSVKSTAEIIINITGIAVLAFLLWLIAAICVKRLHDRNLSGWWFLPSLLIPLVSLWFLYQAFRRGTVGDNRFGPDPLTSSGERQ